MSYSFNKPKLFSMLLAVLVVFLMATGAFVGAANNSVVNIEPIEGEILGLNIAGYNMPHMIDVNNSLISLICSIAIIGVFKL